MIVPPVELRPREFLKFEIVGDLLVVGVYDSATSAWAETEIKIALVEARLDATAVLIRADLDLALRQLKVGGHP